MLAENGPAEQQCFIDTNSGQIFSAHRQGRNGPLPALGPYQDRRREDPRAGTFPLRRVAMPAACTQTIDKSRLPSREELLHVRQAMFDSAIALSDQCH